MTGIVWNGGSNFSARPVCYCRLFNRSTGLTAVYLARINIAALQTINLPVRDKKFCLYLGSNYKLCKPVLIIAFVYEIIQQCALQSNVCDEETLQLNPVSVRTILFIIILLQLHISKELMIGHSRSRLVSITQ